MTIFHFSFVPTSIIYFTLYVEHNSSTSEVLHQRPFIWGKENRKEQKHSWPWMSCFKNCQSWLLPTLTILWLYLYLNRQRQRAKYALFYSFSFTPEQYQPGLLVENSVRLGSPDSWKGWRRGGKGFVVAPFRHLSAGDLHRTPRCPWGWNWNLALQERQPCTSMTCNDCSTQNGVTQNQFWALSPHSQLENSVFLAGFRWQVTMFGVGVGGVVEMQQDGL